uniref:UBP-type domain-containing protein n=1 Tax=Macrostomum lignano TaxID=282301 RepID=A0A1I8IVP2_9PLAT
MPKPDVFTSSMPKPGCVTSSARRCRPPHGMDSADASPRPSLLQAGSRGASDTAEAAAAAECRGQRVPHEIRIASVTPQALAAMAEQPPESQPSTEPKPPALSAAPSAAIERAFFSGNPRPDARHAAPDEGHGRLGSARPSVLVMLAVPAHMTVIDLAQFVADSGSELLEMKIIRGPASSWCCCSSPTRPRADQFYSAKHGEPFSSLEPELTCCLAYVARRPGSRGAQFPVRELVELPTCPVCLDRLDEPLKGILTILCNHSFTCAAWTSGTRPPAPSDGNSCSLCGDTDSLWICLICGYVGCGRYTGGHAYEHFRSTSHTFAMEVGTDRVWDYCGDNFVHRLVQNKATANSCRSAATYRTISWTRWRASGSTMRSSLSSRLQTCARQRCRRSRSGSSGSAPWPSWRRPDASGPHWTSGLARRTAGCRSCRRSWTKSAGFNSGMLANQRDLQERLQAEEARRVAELRKKEEELEQLREEMRDLYATPGGWTAAGRQLVVGEQPQQGASGSKSAKKRSGRK